MCSGQKYLVWTLYLPHRTTASRNKSSRSGAVGQIKHPSGGFPHSDIPGSKGALASPGLIAECHVLHRLLLPRHPPNALIALDPIQKTTGPFVRSLCLPYRASRYLRAFIVSNPSSVSGRKSSTRTHPLGRRRAGSRALNDPYGSDRTHGQCHLTWKDCFGCPTASGCLRTFILEPPDARTRHDPHSGRTQNVSCFALFTMSLCRMSPSGVSVSRRLARAIGQEGSSPG
jgi:hypothetical protein